MNKSPDYFQVEIPGSNDKKVARAAAVIANLLPWTSKFKAISPVFRDAVRTMAVNDPTMEGGSQIFVTRVVFMNPDFGADAPPQWTDTYLITGSRASEYVARITAETLKRQWESSFRQRVGRQIAGLRQRLSDFGYTVGRVGE